MRFYCETQKLWKGEGAQCELLSQCFDQVFNRVIALLCQSTEHSSVKKRAQFCFAVMMQKGVGLLRTHVIYGRQL